MTENEQRPEDPPSYPKNGTYADLLIWHLKIWWTRPDGSPKSRGTKPWTTSELLSKVFGPNRVDIDNQNNLFKNWTGFKKKERSGSENGRKISQAIFGGQPQFLIWANDLENARVRTNGAGKNRLTISIERCLADLVANGFTAPSPDVSQSPNYRKHIGAAASVGVSLVTAKLGKHFFGRESDLAVIDDFVNARMEGGERGLLLITAPAGFGKSALATAWCDRAEKVPNRYIVSHFCSVLAGKGTTSPKKILANLRRQMAEVYGDGIDASDDDDALIGLLSLAPPNRAQLVVWLDGIDEATASVSCFLPRKLGDRVCVIVSARAEENATPDYVIEWQNGMLAEPHKPYRHDLGRLSEDDVRKMVDGLFRAQDLTPPNQLAEQIYGVSEGGYPLFARLMADDAARSLIAGDQVDLGLRCASLIDYAEHQLNRLKSLASWQEYDRFFAFMTVARGTVRLRELSALTGQPVSPEFVPDQILRWFALLSIDRHGPSTHVGFAHPKLAELFSHFFVDKLDDLFEALSQSLASKPFQSWPSYAMGYLLEHFRDFDKTDETIRYLTDPNFVVARLAKLGTQNGLSHMRADWYFTDFQSYSPSASGVQFKLSELAERHCLFWDSYSELLNSAAVDGFDDVWMQLMHDVALLDLPINAGVSFPQQIFLTHYFEREGDHSIWINGLSPLPCGTRCLSWGNDRAIRLWDQDDVDPISTMYGHKDIVMGALALPDDAGYLSWSEDATLRLWRANGKQRRELRGHSRTIRGALLLPRNEGFLSWSEDYSLRLWNSDGTEKRALLGHRSYVLGAKILPKDEGFISWSHDHTLRIWSRFDDNGKELTGHSRAVIGAFALPDGNGFLSWSHDHTLRLWSDTGERRAELTGHSNSVIGALTLSENSGFLSWSFDHTLRLWSYEGKQRAELTGHEDKVSGALLLPNGEGFVSWSHDGTLLKWSADGAKGPAFLGHREAVNGALLLARDRNILSWSMDGTIRVWDSGGRLLNLWFSPAGPISHVEPCEKLDHYFVSFGKYTGTVRLPVPKR